MEKELLFWTFSTIFTSFLALGGVLAGIANSKLRDINGKIQKLTKNPRKKMEYYKGTPQDVLLKWKKLSVGVQSTFPAAQSEINKIEELLSDKVKIKKQTIDFLKAIIIVIICALIFLIFTPLITKLYYISVICMFIIFSLVIISLVATVNLIKKIL